MPSNTEQSRNRRCLARLLRLVFGTVVLLVLFHAEPVFAVSTGVVSIAAPSQNASVDAGVSAEAELPMSTEAACPLSRWHDAGRDDRDRLELIRDYDGLMALLAKKP